MAVVNRLILDVCSEIYLEIKKANLATYAGAAGTAGAVGTSSLTSSVKKPAQPASKWKRPVKPKVAAPTPMTTVQ